MCHREAGQNKPQMLHTDENIKWETKITLMVALAQCISETRNHSQIKRIFSMFLLSGWLSSWVTAVLVDI